MEGEWSRSLPLGDEVLPRPPKLRGRSLKRPDQSVLGFMLTRGRLTPIPRNQQRLRPGRFEGAQSGGSAPNSTPRPRPHPGRSGRHASR